MSSRNLPASLKIEKTYYLTRISLSEKIIRHLFSNRIFVLNEQKILNKLYKLYKRK